MSIRAYKIIEIKQEKKPTFNVGENFDWLEPIADCVAYNDNGECKEMEFEKEDIKNAIKDYKKDDDKLAVLNGILNDFQADDYISYSCY